MVVRARAISSRGFPFIIIFGLMLFAVVLCFTTSSRAYLINFESVSDNFGVGVPVTDQFAGLGVTFENATAVTAGISLNELDFPPQSGFTVVSNEGSGLMRVVFDTPVEDVAGYFTYNTPSGGLLLSAYDAFGGLLGTVSSTFLNNTADGFGDPGSAPNERLEISGVGPIARLDIDPNGGDFKLDDFAANPLAAPVPEPGSLLLMAGGLGGLMGWKRRERARKHPQS